MLWLNIAFRYLFAKKSTQAINIMAGVAGLGVLSASAALIIVLSVFNGLENTIIEAISPFQHDLKISLKEGKFFQEELLDLEQLNALEGIQSIQKGINDKVLLSYNDKQLIVQVVGYQNLEALLASEMVEYIDRGTFFSSEGFPSQCIVGSGIASTMGINPEAAFTPLSFFSPKSEQSFNTLNTGFNTVQLNPIGVFNTQQENDNTLCLAAMDSVQKLLGRPNQCSFVGIDVQNGASISRLKSDIEASLGEDFKVEDIEEQNATLFRILKVEKLSVFIILSFIALIAIVNIMSSLIMLIIEKQKDNAILQSLGASQSFLSKLYFTEGMLIVFLASVLGLVLGGLFSLGQQHFGWITAVSGDGLFEIPYPCVVQMGDFISILLVNIVMASLVVWIAIRFSLHKMKHLTSLNSV